MGECYQKGELKNLTSMIVSAETQQQNLLNLEHKHSHLLYSKVFEHFSKELIDMQSKLIFKQT